VSIVTDQELVLFHYRDGLDASRVAEIEHALFFDAELRLRLAALRETLATAAEQWPQPEADPALEARVWARLAPSLPARASRQSWVERLRGWIEPLRPAPVAFASLLLAALGIGYLLGQREAAPPQAPASLLADDASARMLAAFLAGHLQDTERALLVASHSPDDAAAAQQLAVELLESHRLYALAAERAGKPALAQFLRELEPVLIELANEQGATRIFHRIAGALSPRALLPRTCP
jgi:anti-sigma-K factor RskA